MLGDLRFSGEGSAIICLANVVTLVTTISMSAVSTNGQIKGGEFILYRACKNHPLSPRQSSKQEISFYEHEAFKKLVVFAFSDDNK
jgi:hypothetical protein